MTASVPSRIAFATSDTSARVGRGLWIIDSSICVAVITGTRCSCDSRISRFCTSGTSSNGSSTPRSPRATMMPSARVGDAVDVAERRVLLDLGDDLRVDALRLDVGLRSSPTSLGAAHERERHEIHILLGREGGVGPVLLGERRGRHVDAGEVHPLVRS